MTAIRVMDALAVALLVITPVLGMLVFVLRYAASNHLARHWRTDAIAPALAVAALAVPMFLKGQTGEGLMWLGQACLVFTAIHVLRVERVPLQAGLVLALSVLIVSIHFVDWAQPRSWGWIDSPLNALQGTRTWPPLTLGRDDVADQAARSWRVTHDADDLAVTLTYRGVSEVQTWDWRSASQSSALTRHGSQDDVTEYAPFGANPFVFKRAVIDEPVGGRLFRASLAARYLRAPSMCGRLNLAVAGGTPFHRIEMCLTESWEPYEVTWRVPASVSDNRVDLVVDGLRDGVVLMREASIEVSVDGVWYAVSPLIPEVPWLEIVIEPADGSARQRLDVPLALGSTWRRLTIPIRAEAGSLATAVISTPPRGGVEVRGARLVGGAALAANQRHRARLWFEHPNIFGHTLATTALIAVTVTTPGMLVPVIGAVGIVAIAETGSRVALGVTAVTILGLALRWSWSRKGSMGTVGLIVLAGALAMITLSSPAGSRLAASDEGGLRERAAIWTMALEAVRESPLLGASERFTSLAQHEDEAVVSHAHNQYVQLAYISGVTGIVVSAVLLFTLARASWRRHRTTGLVVVAAVAGVLQIFDATLFSASVMLPLLLFGYGPSPLEGRGDGTEAQR